jgi:methanogenic corrinoid protein MtbC1
MDLGSVATVDEAFELVKENNIKILIVSALMYPSALKVLTLKSKLKEAQLDTKIIVGGAPYRLDKALWKNVDADAMGDAPMDTVNIIKQWEGQKNDE